MLENISSILKPENGKFQYIKLCKDKTPDMTKIVIDKVFQVHLGKV